MRRVTLLREDFAMFHQDITPHDYEFFRNHTGAFKRMWQEQTRRFWSIFVTTFDHFIWNYGVMRDFPLKVDDVKSHIEEIIFFIQHQFVEGNVSSAKGLINDCVIVAQNRHYIGLLDKASYSQNPFYMKETRETFRKLFGPPNTKTTFMKVLCALPVYVKFAGAAVEVLRRWLQSDDIPSDDDTIKETYFARIHKQRAEDSESIEAIHRIVQRELKNEASGEVVEKKPSKKDVVKESTRQKAKEWTDSSVSVSEFSDTQEPQEETVGYKTKCKEAIRSVTKDVRDSLIKSVTEAKAIEIEEARKKGEDLQPYFDELGKGSEERKKDKKKKSKKKKKMEEIAPVVKQEEKEEEEKQEELKEKEVEQQQVVEEEVLEEKISEETVPDEKQLAVVETLEERIARERERKIFEEAKMLKEKMALEKDLEEKKALMKAERRKMVEQAIRKSKETGEPLAAITAGELASKFTSDQPAYKVCMSQLTAGGTNNLSPSDKMMYQLTRAVAETLPEEIANMEVDNSTNLNLVVVMAQPGPLADPKYQHLKQSAISLSVGEGPNSSLIYKGLLNQPALRTVEDLFEKGDPNRTMKVVAQEKTVSLKAIADVEANSDNGASLKKKLHTCGCCGAQEKEVKTFKRCQKCKGKSEPRYYCSKECQVKDWKAGHKMYHKED